MSVLLGQPLFDLLADAFKQRPIRNGQLKVNGVDPSQNGTKLNERGSEFPVHDGSTCSRGANVTALVRTAPATTQAASHEQNPISPEQTNQSGKGE